MQRAARRVPTAGSASFSIRVLSLWLVDATAGRVAGDGHGEGDDLVCVLIVGVIGSYFDRALPMTRVAVFLA
jgi:hypothetical protein